MTFTIPKSWRRFHEQLRAKGQTDQEARAYIEGLIKGTIEVPLIDTLRRDVKASVRDFNNNEYVDEDMMSDYIPEIIEQCITEDPDDLHEIAEKNPDLLLNDEEPFDPDDVKEIGEAGVIHDNLFAHLEVVAWAEYNRIVKQRRPVSRLRKAPSSARHKPLLFKSGY
jgi:hypothetical protein